MKEMSVGITFTQSCAWKPDWKLHWLPLAGDFEGRRPCGRMCCVCVCIDVWGDALMEGTLGLLSAPHNHKTERHAPSTLAIIHTHAHTGAEESLQQLTPAGCDCGCALISREKALSGPLAGVRANYPGIFQVMGYVKSTRDRYAQMWDSSGLLGDMLAKGK